jgi:hypothetical protein
MPKYRLTFREEEIARELHFPRKERGRTWKARKHMKRPKEG